MYFNPLLTLISKIKTVNESTVNYATLDLTPVNPANSHIPLGGWTNYIAKLVKVQVTGTVLLIFSMLVYFHWYATYTNLPNIWTLICWPLLRHDYNISCNGWCSPRGRGGEITSWSTVKLCLHCTSINIPDPFRKCLNWFCNYYVKLLFHLDLLINHLWYW